MTRCGTHIKLLLHTKLEIDVRQGRKEGEGKWMEECKL